MRLNKCVLSLFALAILVAPQTLLHASPLPTLTVGGVAVATIDTDVAGVEEFAYTDTTTDVLNTQTTTFLATFADVAGVDVLNVTDLCAQVTILGPAVPCQALAFTFTDVDGFDANLISVLGTAGVDVAGDIASVDFGASVGGGDAVVNFTPPPVSPTPEPESLGLLATGLLGIAGVVRRRVTSAV